MDLVQASRKSSENGSPSNFPNLDHFSKMIQIFGLDSPEVTIVLCSTQQFDCSDRDLAVLIESAPRTITKICNKMLKCIESFSQLGEIFIAISL
jgi:hypothetical protein